MKQQELTEAQRIQQSYNAALDSVSLINKLVTGEKTDATKAIVGRNKEHLKIMVTKTWATQDLTPLNAAIKTATDWLVAKP